MANQRIVTMEELLERWESAHTFGKKLNPLVQISSKATADTLGKCADDLQPLFDGLREMARKWRDNAANSRKESVSGFLNPYEAGRANRLDRCADQLEKYLLNPDQKTMCKGQCEGTGRVPVKLPDATDQLWPAWEEEHIKAAQHDCDGWHFVVCRDCRGTGLERDKGQ